jgi:hypothetical protein
MSSLFEGDSIAGKQMSQTTDDNRNGIILTRIVVARKCEYGYTMQINAARKNSAIA